MGFHDLLDLTCLASVGNPALRVDYAPVCKGNERICTMSYQFFGPASGRRGLGLVGLGLGLGLGWSLCLCVCWVDMIKWNL